MHPPNPCRCAALSVWLTSLAAVSLAAQAAPVRQPATTASLRGLSVARDGAVWASGTNGTVLRSMDGGQSWELRSIPDAGSLDLRDIEAISERAAYAMVAGADTARIYHTTDGGDSWVRQYDDTRKGVFLDGIAFFDGSHGIAVGDPLDGRFLVLLTEDGGAHWAQLPAAASPAALPGEAAFAASGTAVIVGPGGARGSELGALPAPARPLASSDRAITVSPGTPVSRPSRQAARARASSRWHFVTRSMASR